MEWFINAAKPFKGMEINVLSETIPTHEYESKTLAKAFEEITGIKVNHQVLGEGEVVQAVQTQMQTNRNLYDGYINDSDLIGTHSRLQSAVNLTDWMAGEGKDVTLPTLDVKDFIGISFTTGPDGKIWQLPDQQFANLYWFRYDWFKRAGPQEEVQGQVRLRARRAGELVGLRGHRRLLHQRRQGDRRQAHLRPHGLRQARARPRLAHDRRLAVDGRRAEPGHAQRTPDRRVGHPHGEGFVQPVGASVSRGGETNSPASVYAIAKWDEWLRKYAPPGAADYDFYQSLPALAQGNVAQQIFWYTAFTAEMVDAEERRQQHGRRQGQAAVADGAVAEGPVLGRRHEARLPGRRLVDAVQVARRSTAARPRGSTRSSRCPRRSTSRRAMSG